MLQVDKTIMTYYERDENSHMSKICSACEDLVQRGIIYHSNDGFSMLLCNRCIKNGKSILKMNKKRK